MDIWKTNSLHLAKTCSRYIYFWSRSSDDTHDSDDFARMPRLMIIPTKAYSMLVAPATTPTMLYLLEKKVIQSLRTPFSLSSRSCQSEETSSGLVEVFPRALEASLPANTTRLLAIEWNLFQEYYGRAKSWVHSCTHRGMNHLAGMPCYPSHHKPFPRVVVSLPLVDFHTTFHGPSSFPTGGSSET